MRKNWLHHGFYTAQHDAESKSLKADFFAAHPRPKPPQFAGYRASPHELEEYRYKSDEYDQAIEAWFSAFADLANELYLKYPPSIRECVLLVNREGEVVEAWAIDPKKDAACAGGQQQ
jgi:hypothetical protein